MQPPQVLESSATPAARSAPPGAPPPRRRAWLGGAGLALGTATLGAGIATWLLPRRRPDPAVARLLALSLPDAFGQPVRLANYRNRFLVLNFWATWCPPCLEEMPELSALAPRLTSQGVQLLGLGIDQAQAIAEYARQHPSAYPLLVAGLGGMRWLYELGATQGALPWTVLINAEGQIVQRIEGRLDITQLLRQVTTLQAKKPSN